MNLDINLVHPELRKATASFPKLHVTTGFGRALTRALLPVLMPRSKPVPGISIETVKLPAGLKLRVYSPAGSKTRSGMLYIHGGGMMIGTPAMDDVLLSNISKELDIVIASPDYRLSPEHPFPAPLEDCHKAWLWMQENASIKGIDAGKIAVGGESAGGLLAAGLVLRLKDEQGIQPIAQWLLCPMLDDRTAMDRSLDEVDHFVWNNKMNLAGWKSYLGDKFGSADVPEYAAPARRFSFVGLPPTWIGVGDIELFYNEAKKFAADLKRDGVTCELDVVEGGPHAFEGMVPNANVSIGYLSRAKSWLAKALKG